MDVQAYLRRIGFQGRTDGSAETLGKLQELHLQAVPYENLDIMRGIPLSLQLGRSIPKSWSAGAAAIASS